MVAEVRVINAAIVRPDRPNEEFFGLKSSNFVNPQYESSPFGTVIIPPTSLIYHSGLRNKGRVTSERSRDRMSKLFTRSLDFSPNIMLQEGDRVMYNSMMHVDNEDDKIEDCLIIPYSLIYALVNNDIISPMNGFVFCEPIEYKTKVWEGFHRTGMKDIIPGLGRIKHLGPKVEYKWEYPGGDNPIDVEVGDVVLFDPGASVEVEWPLFRKFGRLLKIQRKDIFAKTNEYED